MLSWQQLASFTVVLTFILSLLAFVFRPVVDNYIIASLKRKRASLKDTLDSWYDIKNRDAEAAELKTRVEENSSRLDSIDAFWQREFLRLATEFKESFDKQTEAMKQIAHETAQTGNKVERILGRMEAWDGHERRDAAR